MKAGVTSRIRHLKKKLILQGSLKQENEGNVARANNWCNWSEPLIRQGVKGVHNSKVKIEPILDFWDSYIQNFSQDYELSDKGYLFPKNVSKVKT